jgi:LysR family nitrogen assimilation transcriptional regulator
MQLRQLQYFLAIAQYGSLSKAATVVGIAQPTLSRSVRHLEKEIGVELFYRHGRGIRLTDKGSQFHTAVGPLVHGLLQAKEEIKDNAGVPAGPITFGMLPSISSMLGPRLVEVFLHRYPLVKLQIIEGLSGHVNEWLVSGRVDMAVLNSGRRSPNIRMDPLLTVAMYHVVRRELVSQAEQEEETVAFGALLKTPLVLPGRNHGLRRLVENAMQKAGIELNILVEIDALEALNSLVCRGVASTILPHSAIASQIRTPDFLIRKIIDPMVPMQFMIAYSLQRPTTVAMRELVRLTRAEVQQAVADGRLVGAI